MTYVEPFVLLRHFFVESRPILEDLDMEGFTLGITVTSRNAGGVTFNLHPYIRGSDSRAMTIERMDRVCVALGLDTSHTRGSVYGERTNIGPVPAMGANRIVMFRLN